MKTIYTSALLSLLLTFSHITEAQLSPSGPICPGTRVTYSVGAPFAGKTLKWSISLGKGVFTATNTDVYNGAGSTVEVKWYNNIDGGVIAVRDESNGNNQSFSLSTIPITPAYSANNISVPCGSNGNVTFEVKIKQPNTGSSQVQGTVVGSRNFVYLPAGVSYVSSSQTGSGSEFGINFIRFQITLSINATASGQGRFRSFYSCSTDPNSTGILSNESVPFQIVRTAPSISFSSAPTQVVCTSGQGFNYTVNTGGVPTELRWTVESGNLLINGSSVYTSSTSNQAYVTANGSGTFKVEAISNGCGGVQAPPLYGRMYVGPPQITGVTVDNVTNSGPVSVQSGSTHYVSATNAFGYVPSYSFSTTTNHGNMGLNLTGINDGNCQIYVYGSYGNVSLNILASNSCGSNSRAVTFYIPTSYRVASNPAQNDLVIAFSNVQDDYALPDQLDIISEKEMKAVKTVNIKETFEKKAFKNGNEVHFNIRDLDRGTYYLRVTNSRQIKEKQVEITRLIFN